MLALIGLEAFADHYPHSIRRHAQRVELARALSGEFGHPAYGRAVFRPGLPDRLRLRRELARLLAEKPRTVVLVTHDIEERPSWRTGSSCCRSAPRGRASICRFRCRAPRAATDPACRGSPAHPDGNGL
jgi:ABC-type nitrate/sulfonate/bicarbonate transport system ATPase subunit